MRSVHQIYTINQRMWRSLKVEINSINYKTINLLLE